MDKGCGNLEWLWKKQG